MSYIFLPEQGEESSAECFSDIQQSVLSRLTDTVGKSFCNDNGTESCRDSQYGTMCEHSTVNRGKGLPTSCAADSPAKTYQLQEKVKEFKANEADCGASFPASLARYDRVSRSWKTPPCSHPADSDVYSATWPKWGTMRRGVCSARTTLAHRTAEKEFGFLGMMWPTPRASGQEGYETRKKRQGHTKAMSYLGARVEYIEKRKTWPTPCATSWGSTGHRQILDRQLSDGTITADDKRKMVAGNGGQLNPSWVEWLMGWPIGWTDCAPLETDKFRMWPLSHGKF